MSGAGVGVLELIVSTQAGGGPDHVMALTQSLGARGWRPTVAGPADGPAFARFRAAGIDIVEVPTRALRLGTFASLRRLVRDRDIRLVHSHGKGAGVYGRLLARTLGVRAVHTFHGIHFERYGAARRAAYFALERWLSRWTDVVINVSRAQEDEGVRLGLFPRHRSRVVRNGVDAGRLTAAALDAKAARAVLGIEADGPVLGCAARFDEVKRLEVLLEASTSVVPSPRVVLIGRGDEEQSLRAHAARLGLGPRAVFAGEIPDAARLFRAFDVYCAPSRKEGMPLAVLAAMALGVPVVASDIPAHREALGDGSAGLVPGTPEGLARVVSQLLADPTAHALLAAEQRARACREFDAARMLAATEAIYREVMGL
jgi:glycosyltransferase involved in cell wall biosynthesis